MTKLFLKRIKLFLKKIKSTFKKIKLSLNPVFEKHKSAQF